MTREIAIGIPFIGRHLTNSWERVVGLLEETLTSVFAQKSDRYRVSIVCNEIPEGPIFKDKRLNFIVLPPVPPEKVAAWSWADIVPKQMAMRRWAVESGADYFFQLDADDLISNRLVEFVSEADPRAGYIIREGYAFNVQTAQVSKIPSPNEPEKEFDYYCGSSVIVSMNPMVRPEARFSQLNAVFHDGHHVAKWRLKPVLGDEPAAVPFAAAVYRLKSGANKTERLNHHSLASWIFDTAVTPDPSLVAEFSLPPAKAPVA